MVARSDSVKIAEKSASYGNRYKLDSVGRDVTLWFLVKN